MVCIGLQATQGVHGHACIVCTNSVSLVNTDKSGVAPSVCDQASVRAQFLFHSCVELVRDFLYTSGNYICCIYGLDELFLHYTDNGSNLYHKHCSKFEFCNLKIVRVHTQNFRKAKSYDQLTLQWWRRSVSGRSCYEAWNQMMRYWWFHSTHEQGMRLYYIFFASCWHAKRIKSGQMWSISAKSQKKKETAQGGFAKQAHLLCSGTACTKWPRPIMPPVC